MKRPAARRRQPPELKHTTIRDFGGGLNIIDTELNLSSRYSPVFDNMVRAADGSVAPRFGWERWITLETGEETSGTQSVTVTTTNGSPLVEVDWTGHPFSDGDHITISGVGGSFNNIPASEFNRTFGVNVVDADNFTIVTRVNANASSTSGAFDIDWIRDTHAIGGSVIGGVYYDDHLVVVSDIGEVCKIEADKTITRIWSHYIAASLGGAPLPWRYCDNICADVFGGKLIVGNGIDKPLKIDFTAANECDYLVDPGAGSSNAYIPVFDLVKSAFRYMVVHDTSRSPTDYATWIRITDKNTDCVFSGTVPDPGIAVDLDISKILASPDVEISGLALLRDKLMVIMRNASVLLAMGTFVEVGGVQVHEPAASDIMSLHGTVSYKTIVEIGSDVFMLDYNGVPSVRLSAQSNTIVPERVSQLIEPMISAHIGRLSEDTLKQETFAVFDSKNRYIHFYLPKYDSEDVRSLDIDPLYYDSSLVGNPYMILRCVDHQFEEGDSLIISGATDVGTVTAANINGTREVLSVLSKDYVLIEIGTNITSDTAAGGGGSSVTAQPVNDESIGYIYHYVPQLRIASWSRFKGMKFRWGCSSIQGRVFAGYGKNIFRFGSRDEPVYGDWAGMYDYTWSSGTSYAVDDRVRDTTNGLVYKCIEAHTSSGASFYAARQSDPLKWQEYKGDPIEWAWELPWADFNQRNKVKFLRQIHFDTKGTGRFTVEAYVDNLYRETETAFRSPIRTMDFMGSDVGGFGSGSQPYGGGRRTKEQSTWLFPARYKLLKLRLTGSTAEPLQIVAISFAYHLGNTAR